MDQEIMAKVNEVLKAHGRRELSMDELDEVVGGKGDGVMNGVKYSEQEFNDRY